MQYKSIEQETAINYDNQTGKWHIYSTYGPHARKFSKALVDNARREYTDSGTLIMIDGDMRDDFYFSVSKKHKLTEEQRKVAAERLRRARNGK